MHVERCGASAMSDEVARENEKREIGREYESEGTEERGEGESETPDEGEARDRAGPRKMTTGVNRAK